MTARIDRLAGHVALPPAVLAIEAPRAVRPRHQVLVVEDDPSMTLLLRHTIEQLGHRCEAARNAEAAVDMLARFAADVALVDLTTPGLDGFALAHVLRDGRPRPLRLVAYTDQPIEPMRARARAAGFDHIVEKPIPVEVMIHLLQPKSG